MQTVPLFLAQASGGGAGGLFGVLPMLLIMGLMFYFMLIRPQQRKEKERQKMISELRAGQRVIFAGGLIGTISEARPFTFLIEIANGVRIEVARGAVSRILKEGETVVLEQHA